MSGEKDPVRFGAEFGPYTFNIQDSSLGLKYRRVTASCCRFGNDDYTTEILLGISSADCWNRGCTFPIKLRNCWYGKGR